jgi:DNA-binding NtrC family response regulator
MRPKRKILLVGRDEAQLSIRRFLLTTRGYNVASASSIKGAIRKSTSMQVDVVVVELDLGSEDGRALVRLFKESKPGIPIILMSEKSECGPSEFLERVKVMCALKRGPKGAARVPAPMKACA